ncbi:MAG TPA: hypothetical protein VN613_08455 [Gemmatimonadaceae bacterium]|nr:hypothetical protein [Gemmatimonadaceae bacterium]
MSASTAREPVAAPAPSAHLANRILHLATAAAPILNRVVLAGSAALEMLIDDPAVRLPRLNFAADSVFQLLSTSMIDRLAVDLQKAGFARTSRTSTADRWRGERGIELDLVQVQTDAATPRQFCLEYATLLTHTFKPDAHLAVRCAAAPAVLALDCASFAEKAESVLESEEIERAVMLIAARRDIEAECAAAPAELRSIIVQSLTQLSASDALHTVLRRALPDAGALPCVAKRVRERIVRMAC